MASNENTKNNIADNNLDEFKQLKNKQDLRRFILKKIKEIKNLNQLNSQYFPEEEEVKKIGKAISDFQATNIKKKITEYTALVIAVLAAIACCTTTGGAIFLFILPLSSCLPLAIALGAVIGFFGIYANCSFLSENFSKFLLSLLKKGGISEYIDEKGKRQQLSTLKKYLFLPLATVTSLTVGLGVTALTYVSLINLVGQILILSALTLPPLLPIIIVGILAAAIGITLTVAMLTATIEVMKNSQNFSWQAIKNTINNLSTWQIIGYVLKGLLVLTGLLGLAYYRFVAGIDLSTIIQPLVGLQVAPIISAIIGVIACIPQIFFTVVSTLKLIELFSPVDNPSQEGAPPLSFYSRIKTITNKAYKAITLKSICLIGNAVGNAVLVIVDHISTLSIFGAIGCFVNSWSGNLPPTKNSHERDRATANLIGQVKKISYRS